MPGGVIEGHVAAHGVADQNRPGVTKVFEQFLEVVVKGTHLQVFGMVRFSVATKVECHDVEGLREWLRQVVPPVGVCATPVKKDEEGPHGVTPVDRPQTNPLGAVAGKAFGGSHGPPTSLTGSGRGLNRFQHGPDFYKTPVFGAR